MRRLSSASHVRPTSNTQTPPVSTFLKVAMGLLLALPLGAYIAGTLVASQSGVAPARPPVVVEGSPSDLVSATSTRSATPSPTAGSMHRTTHEPPEDRRDRDRDDQPEVRVIRPSPHDLDMEREDGDHAEDQTPDHTDGAEEDEAEDAEDEGVAAPEDDEPEDDHGDGEDVEESHDEGDDD
jgi:hypothetical protein